MVPVRTQEAAADHRQINGKASLFLASPLGKLGQSRRGQAAGGIPVCVISTLPGLLLPRILEKELPSLHGLAEGPQKGRRAALLCRPWGREPQKSTKTNSSGSRGASLFHPGSRQRHWAPAGPLLGAGEHVVSLIHPH